MNRTTRNYYYFHEDPLTMVEVYAAEVGLISSEEGLSEEFEEMMEEVSPHFDGNDKVALNEAFSCWADSLAKDGIIHPLQYSSYCYVGDKYD